eukprot:gene12771-12899_t
MGLAVELEGIWTSLMEELEVTKGEGLPLAASTAVGLVTSSTLAGSGRDVPWEEVRGPSPAGGRSWFGVFGRKNNNGARGQGRSTLV